MDRARKRRSSKASGSLVMATAPAFVTEQAFRVPTPRSQATSARPRWIEVHADLDRAVAGHVNEPSVAR
jgi:hypothetical protein